MSEARKIMLTRCLFATVDVEDFDRFAAFKWQSCNVSGDKWYASRAVKIGGVSRTIYLHRAVLNPPDGMDVDHIDGNGLNNRRANLRICHRAQNVQNQKKTRGSSLFKGVSWHAAAGKWMACVNANGRRFYLGIFENEIDAARAYDAAAITLFGEFARPNFAQR